MMIELKSILVIHICKGDIFMEILKVENLSKIYGKGESQVRAIDDISFSVEKGEFVAIVGASRVSVNLRYYI